MLLPFALTRTLFRWDVGILCFFPIFSQLHLCSRCYLISPNCNPFWDFRQLLSSHFPLFQVLEVESLHIRLCGARLLTASTSLPSASNIGRAWCQIYLGFLHVNFSTLRHQTWMIRAKWCCCLDEHFRQMCKEYCRLNDTEGTCPLIGIYSECPVSLMT